MSDSDGGTRTPGDHTDETDDAAEEGGDVDGAPTRSDNARGSASESTRTEAPILLDALAGAAVAIILAFLPFSTVLGGAVAGYLHGPERRAGAKVGALAGLVAGLVFAVVALVGAAFFLAIPVGVGRGFAVVALLVWFLLFAVVVGLVYGALFGALGGYLGAYVRGELNE